MSTLPNVLCLSTSKALQGFHRPLLRYLAQHTPIEQWEFSQSQDEPSSLDVASILLHDYLKAKAQPVHLIGHGINGLLGILYARQYPERVRSLTLLSVGVYPAIDWQAQYYFNRNFLGCSRQTLLAQMVTSLFGPKDRYWLAGMVDILAKDLDCGLSPHSLISQMHLPPGSVPVPLLVCGSKDDAIVDVNALREWQTYFKESDRLWICPSGRYFFHYFHPQAVGEQIHSFWESVPYPSPTLVAPEKRVIQTSDTSF
jgi:pimeloyl-ACP methyl ester carboxylesterase